MRAVKWLLILLVIIAAVGGAGFYLKQSLLSGPSPQQEAADYQEAKALLEAKKPQEALVIIHQYEKQIAQSSEKQQDWLALFIDAHVQTQDVAKLVVLYRHFPQTFDQKEDASLMVANFFVASHSPTELQALRQRWKGRETQNAHWFNLDIDQMVMEGQRSEALKLAQSTHFEGKEDVGRLLRIALLTLQDDAKKAWQALAKAHEIAPEDTSVRSFRAKLLEQIGEYELAKIEYVGAAKTDPSNLYLRDQLAEFFRRRGEFSQALQVWATSLKEPSLDLIWIKALFWQSVARPLNFTLFEENTPPEGDLAPFIHYLLELPRGVYWDQQTFEKLEEGGKILQKQQASFWLRLLQALKSGKEQEALSLLEFNRFTPFSWNVDLEIALKRVLLYRLSGRFALKQQDLVSQIRDLESLRGKLKEDTHPFFKALDEIVAQRAKDPQASVPEALERLMMSPEAFTAAFLAAGWLEAGLQLHKLALIPNNFPDWVGFAIAQALRYNRDPMTALAFATNQTPTPAMELVTAELLVASGSESAGLQKLETIAHAQTAIGKQAAWKLALVYITTEQYDKAKQIVDLQPEFKKSMAGQELLGRIAYLQGDIAEATRIYSTIQKDSPEAKSFFARQAFQDKNWTRARELTEELLKLNPNSLPLRANLQRILEIQEKEQGGRANAPKTAP